MATLALSGDDTFILQGNKFSDLADQNVVELTFPNEIATVKTGKNGNTIYGLNETGKNCELKIRCIRGSADDKFLNNLLVSQQNNFSGFVLLSGSFIKELGDGQGNITHDTYILSGGVFTKFVDGKDNVEGDTEQSISMYTIKCAAAPRALT